MPPAFDEGEEFVSLDSDSMEKLIKSYRDLFENAPAAMLYYDHNAKVRYCNKAAIKLFNSSQNECLGMDLLDKIKHTPLRNAIRKSLEQGFATFEEYFPSDNHKHEFLYCAKFQALYDHNNRIKGAIAVIFEVDITTHYKKDAIVGQVQAKRYFEAAGVMMLALDKEANVVRINTKGCEITGYKECEIVGKNWIDLCIPPEIRNEIRTLFQQVVSKTIPLSERHENDIITKTGERRKISWHNSIICDFDENVIEVLSAGEDITELTQSKIALVKQKLYDELTNLPNRVMFQERLQHAVVLAKENDENLALIYIDIDNFNRINDTFGHKRGDTILKKSVQRIENILSKKDTLIRFGGDEFIIMKENVKHISELNQFIYSLLNIFKQPFQIQHNTHYLTASIGIAIFPQSGETPQTLIQAAETAMNSAKNSGKNQYAFYTQSLSDSLYEELTLENDMRSALANNEFILCFQPQIDLQTKKVIGLEALVRWRHPQKGLIPPFKFIPIAEHSRIIIPLGDWIMTHACIQVHQWHTEGIFNGKVAVNVSGVQMEHGNILETIHKALYISKLPPHMLELEITESILMTNPKHWIDILDKIKQLGISVAIDDFGTGYSSLAYLRHFSLDKLKIDKSFVDDLPHDEDACTIANTIVALAKSLGLQTLAEGIETKEQESYLQSLGCTYAQGYLYAKPLFSEALEEFLQKHLP